MIKLKKFWFGKNLIVLFRFLTAPATAELEPITKEHVQEDEVDMGMTYEELSIVKNASLFFLR